MSPLGSYLVETLVTLAGVIGLAALLLMGGRRLGLGRASGGPLELVGKLPLDPRRAVYLVRVGKLVYVVAASEGGVVRLAELEAEDVPGPVPGATQARAGATFRAVLDRVRGRPTGSASSDVSRDPPP